MKFGYRSVDGLPTKEDFKRLPRVKLPNKPISFFQDMCMKRGNLSRIKWYLVGFNNGSYDLAAKGYGMNGDYGNGRIYVGVDEFKEESE